MYKYSTHTRNWDKHISIYIDRHLSSLFDSVGLFFLFIDESTTLFGGLFSGGGAHRLLGHYTRRMRVSVGLV
jgi:hypothetical protein